MFDIEKIDGQMSALVFVKINLSDSTDIANNLASIPEVRLCLQDDRRVQYYN